MINKGIELLGRFDINETITFAWSGSTIKADFYGTTISVKLKSSYAKDYFVVILDDKIINPSLHIGQDGEYILATNLSLEKHTIELIKKTEFNIGTVEFKGFETDGQMIERQAGNFDLRLEIIGDSLTCGFGSEGDLTIEYDPKYDNAYLAYGMIAARNLNADIRILSCSGYGLIRNYSGDMVNTMPTMIDKITPLTNKVWDYKQYTPDFVAINLGTNDFSSGYIPNKDQFVSAYIQLIDRIKKNYPNVNILCTMGPVLTGNALLLTREYIKEVISHYTDQVYFLEYEPQKQEDGIGISYHPSLNTHQKMAQKLTNKIKELVK